ncbi:hypothetical protein RB195_016194 [Necator americanus]|uniref:7TM GPCR serpentine receptor class x (Srx) domain-containing protein n=1 Tax=Necator americanus TaxID=51031 RepID=A0ABR1E7Z9_NECAM
MIFVNNEASDAMAFVRTPKMKAISDLSSQAPHYLTKSIQTIGDCDFVYDDSIWAFVFTQTEDCKFISKYLDFIRDLTIVIIIGIVDTITVIKVRISSAKAVLQGIVFAVELYTYFILAWQMQNKWAVWALTTMAWNLVHCTDA